ncbi:unnamed protein product [Mytilus coruscus]|uniref:Integrase catalytic domain-containing protein n=1 Tax=Mytilus coruscus TaxID=42192 RepID=A0A6J8BD74_MYTCO|nr:unnamed protein product [Mytilus coruscus]
MHANVNRYIKTCDRCQRAKRNYNPNKPPLSPMPLVGRFHRWHINILGLLSKTPQGFENVLVVVDSFTRWTEVFPMKTQTAKEVATILCSEVFARFESPKTNLVIEVNCSWQREKGPNFTYKLKEIFNNKELKSLINATNLRRYYNPNIHRKRFEVQPNQNNAPDQNANEAHQAQTQVQEETENTADNSKPLEEPQNDNLQPENEVDQENVIEKQTNQPRIEQQTFNFHQTKSGKFCNGKRYMRVEWLDKTLTWEPDTSFDPPMLEEINLAFTQKGKFMASWHGLIYFLMVVLCFVQVGADYTVEKDIIHRINYGIIFKEETNLFLARESWLQPFKLSVPNFSFHSQSISNTLAADHQMHLNLKKMTAAVRNDSKIFKTLSEPLLDGIISIQSDWPDLNAILVITPLGLGSLANIICIYLILSSES